MKSCSGDETETSYEVGENRTLRPLQEVKQQALVGLGKNVPIASKPHLIMR